MWGFPQNGDIAGLDWGPLIWGKLPYMGLLWVWGYWHDVELSGTSALLNFNAKMT